MNTKYSRNPLLDVNPSHVIHSFLFFSYKIRKFHNINGHLKKLQLPLIKNLLIY